MSVITVNAHPFSALHYSDKHLESGAVSHWSEISADKIRKATGRRALEDDQKTGIGISAPEVCEALCHSQSW